MKTRQQKRGEYEKKRKKKFAYLKNIKNGMNNYLKQRSNIEIIKSPPVKEEYKETIMTNRLLFLFPADKKWGRIARRAIVSGVLCLLVVAIKETMPLVPEIYIPIATAILLALDKGFREYLGNGK